MKNFFLSFFFILFSLSLISYAQDIPKLAFGSVYYTKGATVIPGANFSYDIYFFVDSEYGNRVAHIAISVDAPEGWNVYVLPELSTYTYNISGILVDTRENIYVEPRPKLASIPDEKEEDIYYIPSPSGKGYLQAKKVTVYVNVPENVEIGKSYKILVIANATYFGELGAITLSQSRDFEFTVTIKPAVYTEKPVKPPTQHNLTNTSNSELESNNSINSSLNINNTVDVNNSVTVQVFFLNNDVIPYLILAIVIIIAVYLVSRGNINKKQYGNYKIKSKESNDEKYR